jgi:hypothetical protein
MEFETSSSDEYTDALSVEAYPYYKTETGRQLEQILNCDFLNFREQGVALLQKRLLLKGWSFNAFGDFRTLTPENLSSVKEFSFEDVDERLSMILELQDIWTDLQSIAGKQKFQSVEALDYILRVQQSFHNNLHLAEKPDFSIIGH